MSEPPKVIVLGLREVAWPKGEGYLYWKSEQRGSEQHILDLKLTDPSLDDVARLFLKALCSLAANPALASGGPTIRLRLENMSVLGKGALVRATEMYEAGKTAQQSLRFEVTL